MDRKEFKKLTETFKTFLKEGMGPLDDDICATCGHKRKFHEMVTLSDGEKAFACTDDNHGLDVCECEKFKEPARVPEPIPSSAGNQK